MSSRFHEIHASIAYGVALLTLLLFGCASAPQEEVAKAPAPTPAATAEPKSNRRVFEGCDPAKEASRYESWVGENVLVTWAWKEMSSAAAGLEVPAAILRVDSPYVAVTFNPNVANLELFTSVWIYSGHIKSNPDGSFGVDPCSATFKKGSW
jgi:hypothetical protein